MKRQRVIGIFDSGVGGLTVVKAILHEIPELRIVYFGDTAHVPYGNRTAEELIKFGEEIITFLIGQGAEAIVVACNTSSATALPALRERFDIPIIGMIDPGSRLAVKKTKQGRIGLIATEGTVRSKAYVYGVSRALARGVLPEDEALRVAYQNGEQSISLVKAQACPLFVPLIELGLARSDEAKGIARAYLTDLKAADIDVLILGCTHYPFLIPAIREILGDKVILVDPAVAVVEELRQVLARLEARTRVRRGLESKTGNVRYFVSGDPELFRQVGNTLLSEVHDVRKVTLD